MGARSLAAERAAVQPGGGIGLATALPLFAQAGQANAEMTIDRNTLQLRDYALGLSSELEQLRAQVEAMARQEAAEAQPAAGGAGGVSSARARRQANQARLRQQRLAFLRAKLASRAGTSPGFDLTTFFGGLPRHLGVIDRETVDFTLQRSWYDEVIDLTASDRERPGIEVFLVMDNVLSEQDPLYVMFAKAMRPISWLHLGGKVR
jgi:hypothetical protein